MEPSEQRELDRLDGLVRVTELEDEIRELGEKHRRVRAVGLVALTMVVGSAIGVLTRTSAWSEWTAWDFIFIAGLVTLPSFLRTKIPAEIGTIAEQKADLLIQLDSAKQPDHPRS